MPHSLLPPPLVIAAHGTSDPGGQQVVHELAESVGAWLPGVEVIVGWVDVIEPTLADVTPPGAVVVPAFLGTGYHVRVDIAGVVDASPGTVATRALGPAPQVLAAVVDRLHESGLHADAVVLGAAGSSDPLSRAESASAAAQLEMRLGKPVREGYLSAATPTVAEAVAGLRTEGHRHIVVASYLLAPGYFNSKLAEAGAEGVSEPIGAHRGIIELIVDRYESTAG